MTTVNENPEDLELTLHSDTYGSWVEVPVLMLMLLDMEAA